VKIEFMREDAPGIAFAIAASVSNRELVIVFYKWLIEITL
jgi:hypothetical protein